MHATLKVSLALALIVLSASLTNAQTGRLINLSTRLSCETGDAVAVTEFILQGTGSETIVLRGIGPSLSDFGVPDTLRDPTARLLDVRGRTLDFNDNWMDNPDKAAIIAAGLAPTNRRESALIDSLAPGVYTMVEQGNPHGQGVALPEVYDLSDGSLQISAIGIRGMVLTGDHVIISGFIISGNAPVSVLVRALGPSLAAVGLPGVLADPVIELHDGSGAVIASNDNWRDTQEAEIIATGLAPTNDLESALIGTLPPGPYTVVFFGANGATGLGFLQDYSLALPVRELNPAPRLQRGR